MGAPCLAFETWEPLNLHNDLVMELTGLSFLGSQRGSREGDSFQAFAPQTGEPIQPVFRSATPPELERAATARR